MVESSDVSIVVDAQDCPPLPGLYGINEMDPVWSKYSCGFALVVFQEPSEPLTALNQAIMLAW
jgi:hypothetical protein